MQTATEIWVSAMARRTQLPPPPVRRALRIAAGLTQDEIAALLEDEDPVNRATVSRWERGTREPRGRRRLKYAELLNSLMGRRDV